MIGEMAQAKCAVEAATFFALSRSVEFDEGRGDLILSDFYALRDEFCASPEDMQQVLEQIDDSLKYEVDDEGRVVTPSFYDLIREQTDD
jgi:hypothetical protein